VLATILPDFLVFSAMFSVLHFRNACKVFGKHEICDLGWTGPLLMHAVLKRVVEQIDAELRGLDLETAQLNPGGRSHEWSAQQVIEHLILTYRTTSRSLETRLKKGRPSRGLDRTYLQWLLQLMVLSFGKLPRGVPTLDENKPGQGEFAAMSGEQLVAVLQAEMAAMDVVLDRCRYKFGMERVAAHPWLGPLRVDQWRRFHVVHGMHHVAQVRSIIAQVAPQPLPILITSRSLGKKLQVPAQRPLA
jgi:hypothetical protein